MPAYKDQERGTWYCQFYYVDWTGKRKKKKKRGFARKKDAEAYEEEFLKKGSRTCSMTFGSMVELYMDDMRPRLRETTMRSKEYLINLKILPYFQDLQVNDITPAHVRKWQSELLSKNYSPTYVKTIYNQLSAIFNYAVRYYGLRENPARVAGSIGKKKAQEMHFWTLEQFNQFIECVPKFPARVGFSVLFWTGLRIGELLALTPADFDFEAGTVKISKSYQRLHGKDVITTPKTKKSNRTIKMPNFLCDEMKDYLGMLYGIKKKERILTITKSYLHHEMDRGAKEAGVKRIRIHDLRHSHISLLIDMGFSAVAIADRVGHESIEITYRYAHLFPSKQTEMADKLDFERTGA